MRTASQPDHLKNILRIIERYPGLDALALKAKGFNPRVHPLPQLEAAGLIHYFNGGWYRTGHIHTREK